MTLPAPRQRGVPPVLWSGNGTEPSSRRSPRRRPELPTDPYADDMPELVAVLHGVAEVESQPDPGHEGITFEGSQVRIGAIGSGCRRVQLQRQAVAEHRTDDRGEGGDDAGMA